MLLPFSGDALYRTNKFDAEMAFMADKHYSRQTVGSNQFMPPGRTMVLRDFVGAVVLGWLSQEHRDDGELGYNCTIFRNESARKSSCIIREAVSRVYAEWGEDRVFTYIDPREIKSVNPGYCFKQAGWKFIRRTKSGLHLLAKGTGQEYGQVTP